jgi:hypothetical protein
MSWDDCEIREENAWIAQPKLLRICGHFCKVFILRQHDILTKHCIQQSNGEYFFISEFRYEKFIRGLGVAIFWLLQI